MSGSPTAPSKEVRLNCYRENFAQFRHLNEQMNKIPPLAVTLTGGFWYVAVIVKNYGAGLSTETEALARFSLMVFSGVANLALILIAIRIRGVMMGYQNKLRDFAETEWPQSSNEKFLGFVDYSMISIYAVLMLAGACLSFAGAYILHWRATALPDWLGIVGPILVILFLFLLSWRLPRWLMHSTKT